MVLSTTSRLVKQCSGYCDAEELVMMSEGSQLQLEELAGMVYNPLRGQWHLAEDTGINYIAYMQKPEAVKTQPVALLPPGDSTTVEALLSAPSQQIELPREAVTPPLLGTIS